MNEHDLMRRALRLAARGEGITSPNPMVGALVARDGRVVAEGFHEGPGTQHAEALALERAGEAARGATLVVTLEPCTHHGRTPPCTDAIIASRVARVLVGMLDPDRRVSGGGIELLRRKGISVEMAAEAESGRFYEAYSVHRSYGRPFVTYKAATSLDGRVAAGDGTSRWITSPEARKVVHRMRAASDAICIGVGTVLSDDPSLTPRGVKSRRFPARVVVDSCARTPLSARVLDSEAPTLVVTTEDAPPSARRDLEARGAEVLVTPSRDRRVLLEPMLSMLAERGIVSMLLEGGPTLGAGFVEAGMVDKYCFHLAPKLLGADPSKAVISGWAASSIDAARDLEITRVRRMGPDIEVIAYPARKRI